MPDRPARTGTHSNPGSKAGSLQGRPAQIGQLHLWLAGGLLFLGLVASARAEQAAASAAEVSLPDAPQAQAEIQPAIPAQTPASPEQTPSAAASIRGVVMDRDGSVYEGVHITLTLTSPDAPPPKTTISDSNGRFQFSGLPSGPFQLTFASQGFNTQTLSGSLLPSQSLEEPDVVLTFAGATTEVRVTASQLEIAQAQLKEEEQQRIFGVIPNFYVVYAPDAQPLNTRQKFHLAWRSSIDPVTFLTSGVFAGIEQAANQFSGYGQGAQGYAKRFGANYADGFIGTMIGSAILPSLLKQDPRYFYKGTGTTRSRVLYAIANSVICKGDNRRWQVNYSGILGGLAAGGISNLYYPASDRNGVGLTFEETLLNIAGDAFQNLFQEFVVRRLTPKLPSYTPSTP